MNIPISITRELGTPDSEGVVDVNLQPRPRVGAAYLEGYLGPANSVREYARMDHVRVPSGEGRAAILVKVFVDHEHRHRGIGKALVKDFVELCRMQHVDAIYLYAEIPDEDIDLVAWYEGLGFKRLRADEARNDPEMVAHLVEH